MLSQVCEGRSSGRCERSYFFIAGNIKNQAGGAQMESCSCTGCRKVRNEKGTWLGVFGDKNDESDTPAGSCFKVGGSEETRRETSMSSYGSYCLYIGYILLMPISWCWECITWGFWGAAHDRKHNWWNMNQNNMEELIPCVSNRRTKTGNTDRNKRGDLWMKTKWTKMRDFSVHMPT